MEFHAFNKPIFGGLSDSEITSAQNIIEGYSCRLPCENRYSVRFLRNILVVILLGNGVGAGHKVVNLDFASAIGCDSLV